MENSLDPDEMPHNAAFRLGLAVLQTEIMHLGVTSILYSYSVTVSPGGMQCPGHL